MDKNLGVISSSVTTTGMNIIGMSFLDKGSEHGVTFSDLTVADIDIKHSVSTIPMQNKLYGLHMDKKRFVVRQKVNVEFWHKSKELPVLCVLEMIADVGVEFDLTLEHINLNAIDEADLATVLKCGFSKACKDIFLFHSAGCLISQFFSAQRGDPELYGQYVEALLKAFGVFESDETPVNTIDGFGVSIPVVVGNS